MSVNHVIIEHNLPVYCADSATAAIGRKKSKQQQLQVIDVYGQEIEPICNYHTCHHKFSLHGHNTCVCKCNHPQNYTMGISISAALT